MGKQELDNEDKQRIAALAQRVDTIASRIMMREAFISAVFPLMNRKFYADPGITAFTNGRDIGFGVGFCEKLSNQELMFVCLHECMHVVLMHIWRTEGRDRQIANIACDAVINLMLKARGYTMPEGGVLIDWVTEDMSWEEVYRRLLENADQVVSNSDGDDGDGDGSEEGSGSSSSPTTGHTGGGGWDGTGDMAPPIDPADAANMEATVVTAAKMAKACGDRSALVERIAGGGLTPSVPWTDVLRDMLTSTARDDYSYRRPNRRMYAAARVLIPTLHSDAMGGLVIGVDTSGSVSDNELSQISSEITAIVTDCAPEFVEVVYCDASISSTERFELGEAIALHPTGGGGTRFAPVFEHVENMDDPVCAVIYLTDLCGNTDECQDPGVPVVWACTHRNNDDTSVPFGMVVPVTI